MSTFYPIVFIALFIFSNIFGSEEVSKSLENLPRLTAECETLATVHDCVNVISGDFFQSEQEISMLGSEPLTLTRIYDSGHCFGCQFGYGMGISFPISLYFDSGMRTGNLMVEQRQGMYMPYTLYKNNEGRVDASLFKSGYTNCCEAELNGFPPITSNNVHYQDGHYVVILGDGTKRYYQYTNRTYYTGVYQKNFRNFYRLKKEEFPNGNMRYFEYYGNKHIPKQILTKNKSGSLTLNSIDFECDSEKTTITASNGQKLVYTTKTQKGKLVSNREKRKEIILSKVSGDHLPAVEYNTLTHTNSPARWFKTHKVEKPDGRYLNVNYYSNSGRVASLHGPIGPDPTPVKLFSFHYHKTHTDVIDALGNKRIYFISKKRLFSCEDPKYRSSRFYWNDKGQLLCRSLRNKDKQAVTCRQIKYNDRGYPISSTLVGNITGHNPETFEINSAGDIEGNIESATTHYVYSEDDFNLLLKETLPNGTEYHYNYKPGTNLLEQKRTLFDGKCQEREFYEYDENAILITKIEDDGSGDDLTNLTYRRITEIEPQLDSNKDGFTQPKTVSEYYYDPITGFKRLLKRKELEYTNGDLLAAEHVYDANENYRYTTYTEYNDKRLVSKEINAIGEAIIYKYDDNFDKTEEEKLGSGKTVKYKYDLADNLIQLKEEHTGGPTLTTTHTYDVIGNRISTTDPYGNTTTFEYDGYGREIKQTDPFGYTISKIYDIADNIISLTDKCGHTTFTTYNINADSLCISYPDDTQELFEYAIDGNLVKKIERDGTYTCFSYDYRGRIISTMTHTPDGTLSKSIQKQYKGENLVSETDAMGIVTQYEYDGAGRLVKRKREEIVTTHEYDTLGRLWKTIQWNGDNTAVTITEHDNLDRIVEERIENLSGNLYRKKTYAYDIHGNPYLERIYTNANSFSETKTIYNPQNLPILVIDALGNETHIIYVQGDRFEKITTDPLGQQTRKEYDPLMRVTKTEIKSPLGEIIARQEFSYDGKGNETNQIDHIYYQGITSGTTTVDWTYDFTGNVLSETEQGKKITSRTYQYGRLHTTTKPDGIILTYTYDALGRLKTLESSDNTILHQFFYDANNNLIEAKDLTNQTNTYRTYDVHNRMIEETLANCHTMQYSYDASNHITNIILPDNSEIKYDYNPTDLIHVSRIKDQQVKYTHEDHFDLRGKLIQSSFFNGVTVNYSWDPLERCTKIETPAFHKTLSYNPVGNLISTDVQDPIGKAALNQFTT